jgi:hypothetical protein
VTRKVVGVFVRFRAPSMKDFREILLKRISEALVASNMNCLTTIVKDAGILFKPGDAKELSSYIDKSLYK